MLGVDLTPALVVLGVAMALSIGVRVALSIGAARARKRGAELLARVPRTAGSEDPEAREPP